MTKKERYKLAKLFVDAQKMVFKKDPELMKLVTKWKAINKKCKGKGKV